jgi:DNA-binding PadR family transcriptional regulator
VAALRGWVVYSGEEPSWATQPNPLDMASNTRYAILGLLARKPGHGYELLARFSAIFGPGWEINNGQVYDMLETLKKAGWAECLPPHKGRRKIHQITQAGDKALAAWHASPCSGAHPQREELYLRVALARPQDAPHLLRNIAIQEQACVDLLRRYATEDTPLSSDEADEWETLAHETIDEAITLRLQGEIDCLSKMRKRIEHFLKYLQSFVSIGDQDLRPSGSAV